MMYDVSMFLEALDKYIDLKIRAANMGSLSDTKDEDVDRLISDMRFAANGPSGDDE